MRLKTLQFQLALLCAGIMLLCIVFYITKGKIYPFLAENKPVNGELLVVEGWLPDYALKEAVAVFRQGHYTFLVTTGLKIDDKQQHNGYSSDAQCAAKKITDFGFDANSLIFVPASYETGSRTFTCARAFQQWLSSTMPNIKAVDVFTIAGHARKTRIMFQKALGKNISVGIIAAKPLIYDPERWWASRQGLRLVFRSVAGYLYAVVFTLFL